MPLVIGVTGSIATGKSSLCTYLVERYGAIHADGDRVVHRMYDPGRPGFDRVVAAFGEGVIGADGMIDRRVLGSLEWPYGSQVFAIDWIADRVSTGFPFAMGPRRPQQEIEFFHTFLTD